MLTGWSDSPFKMCAGVPCQPRGKISLHPLHLQPPQLEQSCREVRGSGHPLDAVFCPHCYKGIHLRQAILLLFVAVSYVFWFKWKCLKKKHFSFFFMVQHPEDVFVDFFKLYFLSSTFWTKYWQVICCLSFDFWLFRYFGLCYSYVVVLILKLYICKLLLTLLY